MEQASAEWKEYIRGIAAASSRVGERDCWCLDSQSWLTFAFTILESERQQNQIFCALALEADLSCALLARVVGLEFGGLKASILAPPAEWPLTYDFRAFHQPTTSPPPTPTALPPILLPPGPTQYGL